MAPVKHAGRDLALGLVVLLCIEGFLYSQLGFPGLFVLAWAFGALLVFLWQRGEATGKIIAAVLHPPLLLRLLLPRSLRDAVKALPSEPAPIAIPD